MKCPCEECLKLAMCKHKKYHQIVSSCNDIDMYLSLNPEYHNKRVLIFEKTLKSTVWKLTKYKHIMRFSKIGYRIVSK